MKSEVRLIGLTGTNGAGKGEVASYIEKKGYSYFSLSDVIREVMKKEGIEESRNNLIKKGNQLREKHGADILARLVMKGIKGKAVIDSIRNPKEIEFFRKQEEFILIAVDAPVEVRYKRAKMRGREESASNLQEFIEKEQEEMTESEKGQQLSICMNMADVAILNDGSLEDLRKKVEALL